MAVVDWASALDLKQAVRNLNIEMEGDWHRDPWAWPELEFLLKEPELAYERCRADGALRSALVDVPKENWGTRPAVVLDVTDRLIYQSLVDRLSPDLIGDLSPNAFGWRLPPNGPSRGSYSHNNYQWKGYRRHLSLLASLYDVALTTDLVSFFASIPVDRLQESVQDSCATSAVSGRLCGLLEAFSQTPGRTGLPQRSTASSILANMYVKPLDDALLHSSQSVPSHFRAANDYHSFARWMDDMWLFGDNPAAARRAQKELQSIAQSLGLNLNSAKTDVYEGQEVADKALSIEHSAVEGAIRSATPDFEPLEHLVDRLLEHPEKASRTSLKFAVRRMVKYHQLERADALVGAAKRMPHVADELARLFKTAYTPESLQDWFLDYAGGEWASHEWSVAQFSRMFPSTMTAGRGLRTVLAAAIRDANTSPPMLAVAAQRMSVWDRREARAACRDAFTKTSSPQSRRILALAALHAGESRSQVRSWLGADPENRVTLRMLESRGFAPPKTSKLFSA